MRKVHHFVYLLLISVLFISCGDAGKDVQPDQEESSDMSITVLSDIYTEFEQSLIVKLEIIKYNDDYGLLFDLSELDLLSYYAGSDYNNYSENACIYYDPKNKKFTLSSWGGNQEFQYDEMEIMGQTFDSVLTSTFMYPGQDEGDDYFAFLDQKFAASDSADAIDDFGLKGKLDKKSYLAMREINDLDGLAFLSGFASGRDEHPVLFVDHNVYSDSNFLIGINSNHAFKVPIDSLDSALSKYYEWIK